MELVPAVQDQTVALANTAKINLSTVGLVDLSSVVKNESVSTLGNKQNTVSTTDWLNAIKAFPLLSITDKTSPQLQQTNAKEQPGNKVYAWN